MGGIDRREFLRRGAVVCGALAAPRLLAACGSGGSSGVSPGDLQDLAGSLRGRVVLPGTARYPAARVVWNSRFDDARPAAVIQAANARDVQTAVDFARGHGQRLITRSGGHSFAGYSTGDGLVLDLSGLTGVSVARHGEEATLGAGAVTLPTYRALWPQKMAISGGTCPTVGIPGLTMGGGLGVLSRHHGLTCDNLLEVEIVTADGKLLRASARENPDLYWATRGGGGGSFGIVTSLTYRLVPVDTTFTSVDYTFPWSAAERVVAAWQSWLPTSPRRTWSAVQLATQAPEGNASPEVTLELVHAGSPRELDAITSDLLGAIGARPTDRASDAGPFVDVEGAFYCKGLRAKECTLAGKTPAGKFPRFALYSKSDVASGPWPRKGIETLIEWIERRQRDRTLTPRDFAPAHTIGKVLMEAADGAVNDLAPGETAFVHRDNLCVSQYQSRWRGSAPRSVVSANLEWTDGLYRAVEPYRSGFAYQNYIDSALEDWERAYYGTNLPRLRRAKSRYDPHDFFRFAQSVPLA